VVPRLDSADLVARARAAGFDAAAVLSLDALADPSLTLWLRQGYGGAMHYLEAHAPVRAEPRSEFPNFHSALVVAIEYGDAGPAPRDPTTGNISRYVAAEDYHVVVRRRLHGIADAIRTDHPGVETRPFVDANPLNEKVAAALGGLGFIGKHTNLIMRGRGSWCFLGMILLGATTDASPAPEKERCGLCVKCIPACPTAAITAPYVLDARRCISYLTIEWRGLIPHEFRRAIGNRIYGCDDCQEVCPWNRFAHRGPKDPFVPKTVVQGVQLRTWASLGAEGFATTFADSAVGRVGWPAFLRNVLIAVGNSADPGLLDVAVAGLADADPVVRGTAAWAVGELGRTSSIAIPVLRMAAAREKDAEILEEMRRALDALTSSHASAHP